MRGDAGEVVGDHVVRLAHQHPGGLAAHDPRPEHDPVALEARQLGVALVDPALGAVAAGHHHVLEHVVEVDADVVALAPVQRLGDPALEVARLVEVRRQQQAVAREELPQHRQQRLGAEQHLPCRLDPLRGPRLGPVDDVAAERLGEHLLPGVELEGVAQRLVVDVAVLAGVGVPADLGHRVGQGEPAGLDGGVHEVVAGHLHLAAVVGVLLAEVVEEVHPVAVEAARAPQRAPAVDEAVVDGVPLVHLRHHVLHPVPLDDAGLHEAGGGVAVDLEHLDGAVGAVGEVEAGVERRVAGLDGAAYDVQRAGREAEPLVGHGGGHVGDGLQAHRPQLLGGGLEGLHLLHGHLVPGVLVPVGELGAVGHLRHGEDEPLLDDLLAPALTGLRAVAPHQAMPFVVEEVTRCWRRRWRRPTARPPRRRRPAGAPGRGR